MRPFCFLLIAIAVFSSCIKKEFQENLFVRGRLFLTDTITKTAIDSALPKKAVLLANNDGDTLNYLYTDTTDSEGYFTFNLLNDGKDSFVLRYEEKINGVIYTARQTISKAQTNIALVATPSQTKQNGIHLIVKDNAGNNFGKVTTWVFNNLQLFNADTSLGKIFDMVTDDAGVGNKFNLVAGRYYLRIKTKIGNINFNGESIVDVGKAGIKPAVINLDNILHFQNGYELLVSDISNTPVNNAQIYVYKSRVVFEIDSSFTNSILTLNSDNSGKAAQYNVDADKYYLRIIKQVGNVTLKSGDSVIVPAAGIIKKSIIIKQ